MQKTPDGNIETKKGENGQYNNIKTPNGKNKTFTNINTPGKDEYQRDPNPPTEINPNPPKDTVKLELKLKEFDYKYHCNLCPYFCFYKLYYSKTEKKIYISIHCENNSFHKEFLSLEDFLTRKETKFVKMLNVCEICKSHRKNSEDFSLCTNCNFAICNNCEKEHSHQSQSLINTSDIFKNICIIHCKPLLVFCKKCRKPFCIECKCEHDDFDKRDIKAFKLEEKDINVIKDKLNNKYKFVKNVENYVNKLQNHPNFNVLKVNYNIYKNNNKLLIQFIKDLIEYFYIKSFKHHQLYEITQNLYNIVKFAHLQLPNDLNKPGNDDFNSLNNFIGSRASFIIIMDKKQ